MNSALPDRIRQARKKLRLTQAQLAAVVGVSTTAVTDWETGKSRPWENLVALAHRLKVSTDWLLTGETPDRSKLLTYEALTKERDTERTEMPLMHKLPVVDSIAANHLPTFAEAKETELVEVKFSRDSHYCLLVKGRSMFPRIVEGDIVVVQHVNMRLDEFDPDKGPADKRAWLKLNKQVVCAIVHDEDPELKRIYVQDNVKKDTGFLMYLKGDNPKSKLIPIEKDSRLMIVGVVRKIMSDPMNFE